MDELMEFLAGYVRVVHSDRYYRTVLLKYCGTSYLDIITASDVAYIVCLIKNSNHVWLKRKNSDGKLVKPLFTAGERLKRIYGITTWNKSGMRYYEDAKTAWTEAFARSNPQYKILREYWDKWIEERDGGRKYEVGTGHVKKSAHFVLGKRVPNTVEEDEDEYDEDQEEFEYESDPEDSCIINLGNWDRKRGAGVVTRVEYSENGDEQVDEDEEDDEAGGKDGEDVLEDGDENADDDIDDDGERDISGFEERIEREARAAGMTRMYKKSTMASDTTVNNKRQKKSTQPSMMTRRGGKTGEV